MTSCETCSQFGTQFQMLKLDCDQSVDAPCYCTPRLQQSFPMATFAAGLMSQRSRKEPCDPHGQLSGGRGAVQESSGQKLRCAVEEFEDRQERQGTDSMSKIVKPQMLAC